MLDSKEPIKRHYVVGNRYYEAGEYHEFMDVPNLIDIQLSSYEQFLQLDKIRKGIPLENQGLEEVFRNTFPIKTPHGDMSLEYNRYILDEGNIKYDEFQCKQKGTTYSIPLKAEISLVFKNTGEIRTKKIYIGDIPLMTDRGTFIINGAERVVVSQIHRSPGVLFSDEKGVFSSRIIPYRGSWIEFEIDKKKDLIYAKIDRKKRILGTIFLRALGYGTREEIIELFYKTKKVKIYTKSAKNDQLAGCILAKAVYAKDLDENGNRKKLYMAGEKVFVPELDQIRENGIKEIYVIDESSSAKTEARHKHMIINCFEVEDIKYVKEDSGFDEPTKEVALAEVYSVLSPGDPMTYMNARKDLYSMFHDARKYELGGVGRYKLDKKYGYAEVKSGSGEEDIAFNTDKKRKEVYNEICSYDANSDVEKKFGDDVVFEGGDVYNSKVLTYNDIVNTMKYLIQVYIGEQTMDDVDHLGNRNFA